MPLLCLCLHGPLSVSPRGASDFPALGPVSRLGHAIFRYIPQHAVHKRTQRRILRSGMPWRGPPRSTSASPANVHERPTRSERLCRFSWFCSCVTTALSFFFFTLKMASYRHPPSPRLEASGLDLLRMTRQVYAQAGTITSTHRSQDERQLSPPIYLDGTFVCPFCADSL